MSRGAALALAVLPLCCITVVVAAGFWGYSYDDAFITFRYAETWLEQGLLRYNPSQRVLGTTAPGYALLLGLVGRVSTRLGVSIPQLATAISVASVLLTALSPLVARPQREGFAERSFLVLLFGTLAVCLRWNVELLGSELFLATALAVLGGLLLLERGRVTTSALLFSAATIMRLELILAAVAFGIVRGWQRRGWIGFLVPLLVPLLVYLAFLQLEFGRIAPNTLDVRRYGFALIDQDYTLTQWRWLRRTLPAMSCVALLSLAIVGLAAALRSPSRSLVTALAAWLLAHEAVYRVLAVPFAPWYHVPTLLGVLLLAVLGAQRTAALLARIAGRSLDPYLRRPATVLLLAPLLVPSASFVAARWGSPPDPRFRVYREVGRFLRERSDPQDVVATTEIGLVGYESRRPILDLVGLVSPEVLQARRDGNLAELLAAVAPRYVIGVPKFANYTRPLLGRGDAAPRYRRIKRFTTPEYDEPVDLLERLPAPR